jgi:hypothetical protein
MKGGTQIEGVWEQDVEQNILTQEEWIDRSLQKITQRGASKIVVFKQ